uniref:NADH dehydrogenase subunit 4L n=1 Tax=Pisidia serratifrons TaxID=761937 RepID=UPI00226CEF84|nr:NADH dehydrogenase subunit 4L [Pisidia serratifrons]UZA47089.1 NADH dehydrogenase subunit 4L [Pisidia serratifrons]
MENFGVLFILLGGLFVMFCGLVSFLLWRKHLLNSLLSLEFIMLGVFFMLMFLISGISKELNYVLFFLSLVACEGALGLSILVSVVRSHGSDYFKSFNSLGC